MWILARALPLGCLVVVALSLNQIGALAADDPLPSWREGEAKEAIITFVTDVTTEAGPSYVPPAERIAVFDNDGTLWVEQPFYTQFAFAIDRVRAMAPDHPEWSETQPFKAVLDGDVEALKAAGMEGAVEVVMASHAGLTEDEFQAAVAAWLATARHPRFDRPYTALVYQPMLDVLDYLRGNGFKTFIVSGGGQSFLRAFAEKAYGIPPEQVVGSTIGTEYQVRDGRPVLVRKPEIGFVDDKAGKPVGIHRQIGRRPLAAFGNSDGDLEMLQWVTAGESPRLGVLIRHDDAEREYRYDRESPVGRLDKALDLAGPSDWVVVSMQDDWVTVFAEPSDE